MARRYFIVQYLPVKTAARSAHGAVNQAVRICSSLIFLLIFSISCILLINSTLTIPDLNEGTVVDFIVFDFSAKFALAIPAISFVFLVSATILRELGRDAASILLLLIQIPFHLPLAVAIA